MAAPSLQGKRVPVVQAGQRVRGLYSYLAADGKTLSYVWSRRVNGQMKRGRLKTTGRLGQENKTQAVNEFNGLFVDVERGEVKIGDRSLTVRKLCDTFIERERGVLGTRASRSIDLYESRLRLHVYPKIGTMKCEDVTVQHIRRLIDQYNRAGQAGSSVQATIGALAACFRFGVLHLGVGKNPIRDLERRELPSKQRRSEPRYLTIKEVEKLLARMSDESRPVASVCFYAAARVSEALALKWSDIDFDNATIRLPGTKTKESDAVVRLLPPLAEDLKQHRARTAALGFDRIKDDAYVFQTATGKRPDRRTILRAVNKASVKAGLVAEGQEQVGVHDLRHSLASYAFTLMPANEVSKLLRHANTKVTLSVYDGVAGDDNPALAAGDKLAAALS